MSDNLATATLDKNDAPRAQRHCEAVSGYGQIVLVFQGGGALGAYQAGVYQALHETGIEPDWIIGTSIGAINASLIAGNEPDTRLARLEEFWDRMSDKSIWNTNPLWAHASKSLSYWKTVTAGIPGFFEPNPIAFLGANIPLGVDRAGYYSTAPLEQTLLELVDFSLINRSKPRLAIGAAHLRTSKMRYFDSSDTAIDVKHILASGALPPAFPAVRIEGELYWDGGVLSNTPTELVFQQTPRRDSLIFAVHMWDPDGAEPWNINDVLHRHKEMQYASRLGTYVAREQETHRLRHVITQLAEYIPEKSRLSSDVEALVGHGCLTHMHIVRLLAPRLDNDDQTKDVDFSPSGIKARWEAGYEKTLRAIEQAPWRRAYDHLEGVILHEPRIG
jgi:NTE family protein